MKTKKKSTTKAIIDIGEKKVSKVVNADNEIFKECLNIVAGTKEGQYVLNRLMEKCGHLKSSVIQNPDGSTDEGTIEYREGRRSIWIYDLYKYLNIKSLKTILFLNRRLICTQRTKK